MIKRHPWFIKISFWDKFRNFLGFGYSPKTVAKLDSNRAALTSVLREAEVHAAANNWGALAKTTKGTPLESLLVKNEKNNTPKK
jgi:hypothetical protein